MKLIDEAINLLGDASKPLADAFFKAQIIAHRLKDKDFSAWVKNEVQGYKDDADLPEYRVFRLTPYGDVENTVKRYTSYQLPLGGMPREMQDKFLVSRLRHSIAVIDEFSKKEDALIIHLPPFTYGYLRKGISDSFSIVAAWGKPPAGCFTQVLHEARSRLLGLLLELADVMPEEEGGEAQEKMPNIEDVNGMFKGAVFGDGANINLAIGHGSQASNNKTSVVKNDISSLVSELSKNKVSEADIDLLKTAINEDAVQVGLGERGFGDKVRGWLGAMITKAGTPAWEVPAQIGAGVLTDAISKYYGLS